MPDLSSVLSVLQTAALVGGAFYYAGAMRSDTRELKRKVADHENRLRAVEGVPVPVNLN